MFRYIDDFLNRITMYRLILFFLLALLGIAAIFCFLGILPYSPTALIAATIFITAVCWLTNTVFAKIYKVQTNIESVYITALILALIISPPKAGNYLASLAILIWAPVLAIASKYILVIKKKHIFNPAALSVALTGLYI